ncbi:MAG: LOG family protein [Gammaproteobacteria bacterium]|nr:LOG family protein [Gammaproteobacteria bacterium]
MNYEVIDAHVYPDGQLDVLSKIEVSRLLDTSQGGLYTLFRNSSLAVLNCGNPLDDGRELLERYKSFDISLIQEEKGISLKLNNAPISAFVDNTIIKGIGEHLFSVLRDVIYVNDEIYSNPKLDLNTSEGITDAVFHILRNADVLQPNTEPNLVVCWGGHSISRKEYDYSKQVGYQLGLRGLNICTGCGPGAMKGPMKGATIGHAKQRIKNSQYLGLTEPGIIAAEPPNPIVNDLVILPDIEKRLEAFVRLGHAMIVFPGGVGTAEEIFYTLGVLMHPSNQGIPFPLIFTGPESAEDYFIEIDNFILSTLGKEAQKFYKIIIADSDTVAKEIQSNISKVREYRENKNDAYYFNWTLNIDPIMQVPFIPTHENMLALQLHQEQEKYQLAANFRNALSGIVAGNVKEKGIKAVESNGPLKIKGDAKILKPLESLLKSFAAMQRMKISSNGYTPCYEIEYSN